jgi:hypothetical protein
MPSLVSPTLPRLVDAIFCFLRRQGSPDISSSDQAFGGATAATQESGKRRDLKQRVHHRHRQHSLATRSVKKALSVLAVIAKHCPAVDVCYTHDVRFFAVGSVRGEVQVRLIHGHGSEFAPSFRNLKVCVVFIVGV